MINLRPRFLGQLRQIARLFVNICVALFNLACNLALIYFKFLINIYQAVSYIKVAL